MPTTSTPSMKGAKSKGGNTAGNNGSSQRQGLNQSEELDDGEGSLNGPIAFVDSAKDSFVEQLNGIAEKVKAFTPKSGSLNSLGEFITDSMSSVTTYLDDHSAADLSTEAFAIARKYPFRIAATIAGGGLGYYLAHRYESRGSRVSGKRQGSSIERSGGSKRSNSNDQRAEFLPS